MLDLDDHFELWEPPADLIDKAGCPGSPRPRHRPALKVGREQIVGLLTALRRFAEEDPEARRAAGSA